MNSQDLQQFLNHHHIEAEIIHLTAATPTVAAAAAAIGCEAEQIVKTILFLVDKKPCVVIANGLTRIDYKRMADHLGVSRRRIKSATTEQLLTIVGYPAGAVPPFGHKRPLPTLMEVGVLSQRMVYGGGGELNALMRLSCAELQRVTAAEVVAIAKLPKDERDGNHS